MPIREDFLKLSNAVRPRILALARKRKLIETCFQEFVEKVYPGAPKRQLDELRVAFFAGVAEFHAMQVYAADTSTDDATDEDMELYGGVLDEVDEFYQRVIKTANLGDAQPGGNKKLH